MTLHQLNRRRFLKNASKVAGAFTGASYLAFPSRVFGANDRIRVAVVGIHGQGNAHIASFHNQPGAEVVALCDVDENVLQERASQYEKLSGRAVRCYRDMRQLFGI